MVTGTGIFPLGSSTSLQATPDLGYIFVEWNGDAVGFQNPLPVVADSNILISALFNQDQRDPDEDGLSNYQELIIHETDPNDADTDGDGFNDGVEIAESSNPNESDNFPTRTVSVGESPNGVVTVTGVFPH